MKLRYAYAALPLALAALAFVALTASPAQAEGPFIVAGQLARAAAFAGCLLAARQFDPGDYMRRAWLLMGATYPILMVNALLFDPQPHLAGAMMPMRAELVLSGALVGVANAFTISGEVLVGRTWKAAGLDLQVSRGLRLAATGGAMLLAVALSWSAISGSLHQLGGGDLVALGDLASDAGDVVALGVLAPIVLTAISLRGGSLAWPWSLIAFGGVAWLCFDTTSALAGWLHLEDAAIRPLMEAFRMLGCTAYLGAGLLQRAARLEVAAPAAVPALG